MKSEFRFVQVFSISGCLWRTLSIVSGLRHIKIHVKCGFNYLAVVPAIPVSGWSSEQAARGVKLQ